MKFEAALRRDMGSAAVLVAVLLASAAIGLVAVRVPVAGRSALIQEMAGNETRAFEGLATLGRRTYQAQLSDASDSDVSVARGDVIRYRRHGGLVYHYAVAVNETHAVGNNHTAGVRYEPILPSAVLRRRPTNADHAEEVARRAESRVGENLYSLIHNNCEHFANWCFYQGNVRRAVSKQVADWSGLVAALVAGVPASITAGSVYAAAFVGAVAGYGTFYALRGIRYQEECMTC